jgi:drug/metabolite transporter (DMT)-like permease
MSPRAVARLQVLAAAAFFSVGGALIKACQLTSWQVACFRSGTAALAILAMAPASRRRWTGRTWIVATAYAATLILFVQANKLTTSANAIFLQSTAPLYLLVLGPVLLREPVRARHLALLVAFGAGMALCFLGSTERFETAPNPPLGDLLAAASGATWALTVTGLRWMARAELGPGSEVESDTGGAALASTVAGNALACAVCLPFAFPVEAVRAQDVGIVALLGTVQIGLAYVCLTAGMRRVPALEGALLLLLEPVLNPVWAWIAHGERPGPWSFAGAAVILVATTVHAATDRRRASDAG